MYRKIVLSLFLLVSSILGQTRSSGSDNVNLLAGSAGGYSVTVGGAFVVNGTFTALPFERVDQFITRLFNQYKVQALNNLSDPGSIEMVSQKLESFSRRNILLKRNNGEEIVLDLDKFHLTGDFKNNPFLKNDDVLIFSRLDIEKDFVSVDGAVNNPVKFPFIEGDRLSDALLFARGISKVYENVTKAEIMRSNYYGTKDESIVVDVNSDIPLKRADRIRILANETGRKDYKVLVIGEVFRPGYISITKDNTTVKDIISKAGGFKPSASLINSELIRGVNTYEMLKKSMLNKNNVEVETLMMERMSYLTEDDTSTFKIDDQLRLIRGNGLVDFTKLATDTTQSNFRVKDGDVIIVPQEEELVYIYGQISSPGYLAFEKGKDVNYYIQKAGGLGELAKDVDEISVIKARTRRWVPVTDKNLEIEPGDYIWVPKKIPRTFAWYFDRYMTRVGAVASIVGSIVTVILLARQAK